MARDSSAKDALLDAALAVHAARGPEGFTIHAVVEESGRSLGSLYHHFGSFDGLAFRAPGSAPLGGGATTAHEPG